VHEEFQLRTKRTERVYQHAQTVERIPRWRPRRSWQDFSGRSVFVNRNAKTGARPDIAHEGNFRSLHLVWIAGITLGSYLYSWALPGRVKMQGVSEVGKADPPMLVYDGACGFCNRSVQFILAHEARHDLLFVARDSELGRRLRRTYGMEAVESMLWIEGNQVFTRSSSVVMATVYLGGWWSELGRIASLCPSPLLSAMYNLIANSRRRLMKGRTNCLVPTPDQRNRFVS